METSRLFGCERWSERGIKWKVSVTGVWPCIGYSADENAFFLLCRLYCLSQQPTQLPPNCFPVSKGNITCHLCQPSSNTKQLYLPVNGVVQHMRYRKKHIHVEHLTSISLFSSQPFNDPFCEFLLLFLSKSIT